MNNSTRIYERYPIQNDNLVSTMMEHEDTTYTIMEKKYCPADSIQVQLSNYRCKKN